ncbi:bifunctional homocysteine S-methyltransferase/methylenetetrahydrofolate reductase [Anaeromicropila populeti]|uniref:Homocysteine S-methyltransferase n=1 Tax=Anaeromicropila populeti TaxID=37658 RepID=A0A1I6KQC7_9FIRM|nr:bifunctional homocysteine S-methyltransferase/methylenetetrahydrofolate reductase [Anaeromicropila populeti]SFR93462.1 homocysteine S-methyltransferase [Anaeromicropila populeti]
MKLQDYLKKHRLVADGAMGTYYSRLHEEDKAVAEFGNIKEPKTIEMIHRQYIESGARLIRTNTFAANTVVLGLKVQEQIEIISKACEIAKTAAGNRFAGISPIGDQREEDLVFIAGDIGPIPVVMELGEDKVLEEYKRICDLFIEEKLSAIIFETFVDLAYLKELAVYIKQKSDLFVICDFCVNKNGYTEMGISGSKIWQTVSEIEEIDAIGLNCGIGSGHMHQVLSRMNFPNNKYIVAMPNAGYPEQLQNRMTFMDNAEYFVDNMAQIAELGIDIVGGCCGTTPHYIEKLAKCISLDPSVRGNSADIVVSEPAGVQKEIIKNDFYEKLRSGKKVVAVELDPPFDASYEKLMEHAQTLKDKKVDIITMADSPMGRSRVDSILMSTKLKHDIGVSVMPHICCRDKNMIAMRSAILGAYINDIRNFLLVTGDPVPSVSRMNTTGVFDYNSINLMSFVKEMNEEHFSREPIYYGGALNYARGVLEKVADRMKRKMDVGCTYFLTQPIYIKEDIERIYQLKKTTDSKILCGIMPPVSYRNANFLKNELAGIHVTEEIVARYHMDMTKEEAEQTGADIANEIIGEIKSFADGYYFMLPFNRVSFMDRITIE